MIARIVTDEQIMATYEVMRQLRPHVPVEAYLGTVQRLRQSDGYQLVAAYAEKTVCAVAGYRFMEMLYCGKMLYVDDLITDERYRSQGYGQALLNWLKAEAQAHGCRQLHLDSGVQREQAHRFYFREGLAINCYHFYVNL